MVKNKAEIASECLFTCVSFIFCVLCRYYNIDTNFVVDENGDCKPGIMNSPDEGFGELNVSGFMNSEYIVPNTLTPEKKFNPGKIGLENYGKNITYSILISDVIFYRLPCRFKTAKYTTAHPETRKFSCYQTTKFVSVI